MTNEQIAALDDEQAMRLEDNAKRFYLRVLVLMNETGCSTALAIAAVEQAEAGDA